MHLDIAQIIHSQIIYPHNLQPERLVVRGLDSTGYSTRRLHSSTVGDMILDLLQCTNHTRVPLQATLLAM